MVDYTCANVSMLVYPYHSLPNGHISLLQPEFFSESGR